MNNSILQRGVGIAFILTVVVSATLAAPEQAQREQMQREQTQREQPQRQQGQRGQRGQSMGGLFGGGFDLSALQQRLLNVYKEQLGVTDEEWTVLLPRLAKVRDMTQKTSNLTAMTQWNVLLRPRLNDLLGQGDNANPLADMIRRFVDGRMNDQMQGAQAEQDPIQKALMELQETLAKPAPSSAEIKTKMMAFRGAKEKARQELMQAQKELTEVLTLKQEATLLMLGILE